MVLVLMVYLTITVAISTLCIPKPGQEWIEVVISSGCEQRATITGFIYGGFNAISDLYLFFLPLSIVRKLQIPRKKKIGIYAVFGLGFL